MKPQWYDKVEEKNDPQVDWEHSLIEIKASWELLKLELGKIWTELEKALKEKK